MTSERRKAEKLMAGLYRRADGFDLGICAYCGDHRQSLDHVPPISLAVGLDLDVFKARGGRLLLFPACLECNGALHKRKLGTYAERLTWLYDHYRKQAERRERAWEPDELGELGRNLALLVADYIRQRAKFIRKFRGCEKNILKHQDDCGGS